MKNRDPLRWRNRRRRLWSRRSTDVWQVCFLSRAKKQEGSPFGASPFVPCPSDPGFLLPDRRVAVQTPSTAVVSSETIVRSTGHCLRIARRSRDREEISPVSTFY